MSTPEPIGYVIWFPRVRSYYSRSGWRTGAERLDQAKLFQGIYDAEQTAKKLSYPTKEGQVEEPYEINAVGLKRWEGELLSSCTRAIS